MSWDLWLSPEADLQIVQLGQWWQENRTAAPNLFKENLDKALNKICEAPGIGKPVQRRGLKNVRRYQIKRTPYLVYYMVLEETREIAVLSVWSAMRGQGPPLKNSLR